MNDRYDFKGYKIRTREGLTGYVAPEIRGYFEQQCLASGFRVVPGHWPSMETREDVDEWIEKQNELLRWLEECPEE